MAEHREPDPGTGDAAEDAPVAAALSSVPTQEAALPESGLDERTHPLEAELARVQEERDAVEAQYNALLEKLAVMRTTVSERLRQDSEELDRREQQIERLTAQVGEYEASTTALQEEVVTSHADTERLTGELDTMRAELAETAAKANNADYDKAEAQSRALQATVNSQRVELDRWESAFMEERSKNEELETTIARTNTALQDAHQREAEAERSAAQEKQVARQLQQALEEMQYNMQRTASDFQEKHEAMEAELETCTLRLHDAEHELAKVQDSTSQSEAFAHEVKEKNLLIGKLRHEAVILNEHLTDALQKIRREGSEALVDRSLVTNLLLQFLAVPRADAKRFEILKVMASVLQWNDEQRERAGLQRTSGSSGGYRFLPWNLSSKGAQPTTPPGDESVSNLFLEFLLSEVERGKEPAATPPPSTAAPADFDLHRLARLDQRTTPDPPP